MDENSLVLEREKLLRSKRTFGKLTLIFGIGIVLPPLLGLVGTVIGMIRAFGELQKAGGADPSVLAGDISIALLTTLWGLGFSALSFIPFILFLFLYLSRRNKLHYLPLNK
ncbi:MAG: MotA/TolQ/ExbB proton channel family protein [Verrucomicrobiota bacterium]